MGLLVARLTAVAFLVLGIVVMHHVAWPSHDGANNHETAAITVASGEAATHVMAPNPSVGGLAAETEDDAPSADHSLLHLCLAVIIAAAMLLVGWLLLIRRPWISALQSTAFRARRMPARPPPRPHGSALLVSLCVMRT